MLPKGSKVDSPHVRATGKNGTIHAVARSADGPDKALCGRVTVTADQPMKRFQQGLGAECVQCTGKVVAARLEAIKVRKALRSTKNQDVVPETVVAKPVVTEKNAKPAKAAPAKKAPVKAAAKAPVKVKSNVTPISKAASKRPAKPKVAVKAAAAAKV